MLILLCVMLVMLDLHFVVRDGVLRCIILLFADLVCMIWPDDGVKGDDGSCGVESKLIR